MSIYKDSSVVKSVTNFRQDAGANLMIKTPKTGGSGAGVGQKPGCSGARDTNN